jgi:hypothetical protein
MKNSIFLYEGQQKDLISEKFIAPVTHMVQLYVWKSWNGQLGFNINSESILFTQALIGDKLTILFPNLEIIDTVDLVLKKINNLRGITFLDHELEVRDIWLQFEKYKKDIKTNVLLERYGKSPTNVQRPIVLDWFDSNEGKYTASFLKFCNEKNIRFITWAFSDFGIYFFSFLDVKAEILLSSEHLDVEIHEVDDINKMPYY